MVQFNIESLILLTRTSRAQQGRNFKYHFCKIASETWLQQNIMCEILSRQFSTVALNYISFFLENISLILLKGCRVLRGFVIFFRKSTTVIFCKISKYAALPIFSEKIGSSDAFSRYFAWIMDIFAFLLLFCIHSIILCSLAWFHLFSGIH